MDKWQSDLKSYIDGIPYGRVRVEIVRARSKTIELDTDSIETIKYEDNKKAKQDYTKLLDAMEAAKYNGAITFSISFNNGKIKEIGYYNSKQTKYNAQNQKA